MRGICSLAAMVLTFYAITTCTKAALIDTARGLYYDSTRSITSDISARRLRREAVVLPAAAFHHHLMQNPSAPSTQSSQNRLTEKWSKALGVPLLLGAAVGVVVASVKIFQKLNEFAK
ncbi:hypothetical protein GN244_ATG12529 [Phytophthora infestans]|uniref:Secreted RxLR effector peptide protein n=1 Tax=Phytophthora infestans TaxID=4787 RepID=A0A833T2Y5_PHYIN|nr:hypothetical protein GN244_ATG15223 [Phytophthora infestans]KAF4035460.1 hypothetical protein GN244_ATG12529 [Phytophthora infestans]KAF4142753.1 hypothetical protein GN958_ATG08065 [Phytophthora infestans]